MQTHSTEPTARTNGERHHEKLKFMGLEETRHLGRNYCNLKGGCRPVYKSKIWKRRLILLFFFFFFNLVCIPVMKLWCELPDVRGKTVESELSRRQFPPFLRAFLSSYYTPVAVPSAGTSHARVGPSGRAGRAASTLASLLVS